MCSLLTRLNPYRDNPILRSIFFVKRSSIGPSSFQGKNLIVDLHNLDKRVAYKRELRLIYNCLTTAYLREALNREETSCIKNMFVADEAQLLVPRILKKAIVTDTWVTTDFATRLRKRGESLVVISQSPSNIEDDIRKNAQNIFVFRLQDEKDIRAIAAMTPEHTKTWKRLRFMIKASLKVFEKSINNAGHSWPSAYISVYLLSVINGIRK